MINYLFRFTFITLAIVASLWGVRWYLQNKYGMAKPKPMIRVLERAFLAPGKQGIVVEVGRQMFFVVMSDKHSAITELKMGKFADALMEEVENVNDTGT